MTRPAAAAQAATLAPGLLLAGVVALAASHAAQRQGGSPLIYALLLGLALHWAAEHPRAQPGLAWAAGPLLRLGVGLLGARLALAQLAALGAGTLATMAATMAGTLLLGLLGARLLRLPWKVGLLAGGANAVCGASATLALASVLLPAARHAGATPTASGVSGTEGDSQAPGEADQALSRHALVIAACATTLSTLAMLVYPLVAHALGLDSVQTGIFLGGSIQDVAQVVAAGYAVSPLAGDTAIALKLARVAMLGPLVALVALGLQLRTPLQPNGRRATAAAGLAAPLVDGDPAPPRTLQLVPCFVLLFFGLMAINSAGWLPLPLQSGLGEMSQACVTVAVAALGMRLSARELARAGWRPFALMTALAACIAIAMLLAAR